MSNHPIIYMLILIICVGGIFSLKFFSYIDSQNSMIQERNIPLDSARYFLASFVVFNHATRFYPYIESGKWNILQPAFHQPATYAVSLFFAITGYLFWGKIQRENLDWISLYKNRFFRIVPLIIFMVLVICITTSLYLKEVPSTKFLYWLNPFTNNQPDFNSIKNAQLLNAGVLWTLVYEWGFYLSLPILYFFRKTPIQTSISLLFIIIYANEPFNGIVNTGIIFPFILGMLAGDISKKIKIPKKLANIILISSIACVFLFDNQYYSVRAYSNLIIFLSIISLIQMADLWGFLKLRGFERLGSSSYSIYILHGFIMFITISISFGFDDPHGKMYYYITIGFILTTFLSSLSYKFIEIPFINLGRKFKINQ